MVNRFEVDLLQYAPSLFGIFGITKNCLKGVHQLGGKHHMKPPTQNRSVAHLLAPFAWKFAHPMVVSICYPVELHTVLVSA